MNIIIPGLHNSDENHWQTKMERAEPEPYLRIQQDDWEQPNGPIWINEIEKSLQNFVHRKLLLIGHSLGCVAMIKWYEKYNYLKLWRFII
jgi:predicted alpha/beta hydrolase family esterase